MAIIYWAQYAGVRVYEANGKGANTLSYITNNNITHRLGANSAYNGIDMMSANRWSIANNYITLTDNNTNKNGILVKDGESATIGCNHMKAMLCMATSTKVLSLLL
ncbi:MAG: hypothetical protein IPO27_15430 [Bacteroidetes bacterium]|nr:hypothetical protein [Bacteroidota bacterium]